MTYLKKKCDCGFTYSCSFCTKKPESEDNKWAIERYQLLINDSKKEHRAKYKIFKKNKALPEGMHDPKTCPNIARGESFCDCHICLPNDERLRIREEINSYIRDYLEMRISHQIHGNKRDRRIAEICNRAIGINYW